MGYSYEKGAVSFIAHAYESPYKKSGNTYNPKERQNRYTRVRTLDKKRATATNPYGNYKSPYYDPVARHERYMRERSSLGIGKGSPGSSATSSNGSSRGSSGSGSGSTSKGSRGRSSSKSVQLAINKLQEESSLNSDVQREVARRKIEDLQNQLQEKIKELRKNAYDSVQSEDNTTERRMIVENLKNEILNLQNKTAEEADRIQKNLSDWINKEQESLAQRIAKLQGTKYDPNAKKVKEQQQKKRDKEVNSRADAIYKSKTKKK